MVNKKDGGRREGRTVRRKKVREGGSGQGSILALATLFSTHSSLPAASHLSLVTHVDICPASHT